MKTIALAMIAVMLACACPSVHAQSGTTPIEPAKQPTPPTPAGKIDLRPKFAAGKETRFQITMQTTGKQQSGQGPEVESKVKYDIGLLLRVKSSDDNGAKLEVVYESLKMSLRSALLEVDFDSSKPPAQDAMGSDDALRSIVGLTLQIDSDRNGNISNISAPAGAAGAGQSLLQQFTAADVVRQMFGPITTLSSGTGFAAVGESWVNEDVMQGVGGPMRIRNTYRLESHTTPEAKLDIQGTVSLGQSASSPVSIREGTTRGKAVWDTALGVLKSMEYTQKLVIDQAAGDGSTGAGSSTQEVQTTIRRR